MTDGAKSIRKKGPPSDEEYRRMSDDVITYGTLALAMAMAKETGIVQVLYDTATPLTSSDIAQKAGLKERYVREVLDALTAARFLSLSPGTGGEEGEEAQYNLLPQHRDVFKQTAADSLMCSQSARLFDQVKQCFQPDASSCVMYDEATLDLMEEMKSADDVDHQLHALLQTPTLQQLLEKGMQVAEIGCGSAKLSLKLAAMFPKSHFTLTDVTSKFVDRAQKAAKQQGLGNVICAIADIYTPPADWAERFDWILTSNVIHDLPHPQKAVDVIFRSLRHGGHFSVIDYFTSSFVAQNVGSSEATLLYSTDVFFCIPESYQQPDSEALGACWGIEAAQKIVEKAGFRVLGLTKWKDSGVQGVLMCQKTV